MSENQVKLIIAVCFIVLYGLFIDAHFTSEKQSLEIQSLKARVEQLEKIQTKSILEMEKLEQYCIELEQSDSLDKSDINEIWRSLGVVRANFVAIGHSLHLTEEDICPESECKEEWENINENFIQGNHSRIATD